MLERGGAAVAAKTSLEKGKGDPELLSLSSRLIGNMTYDHGSSTTPSSFQIKIYINLIMH